MHNLKKYEQNVFQGGEQLESLLLMFCDCATNLGMQQTVAQTQC